MTRDAKGRQRDWIICQIGAREHYVLPRVMHAEGRLRALYTDIWCPPSSLLSHLPGRRGRPMRERYHMALSDARVEHFTASALALDLSARIAHGSDIWSPIMARNAWFQSKTVAHLARSGMLKTDPRPAVFSYSYAAKEIFRAARDAGCQTVLGQIDPGPLEEDIVAEASAKHPELKPRWRRAPARYWQDWHEECDMADVIVVNSPWSLECLVAAGIDKTKISIVPLAFEAAEVETNARTYPERFTAQRPLRVLFLGSLVIRKGIAELLEAVRLLKDEPVEFHLVGGLGIDIPAADRANPKLIVHGPVPRGETRRHYAAADVFILPSLSDGFGLTLLEAQAQGLPAIASRRCGEVVEDGVNGLVLEKVTGEAIVEGCAPLSA